MKTGKVFPICTSNSTFIQCVNQWCKQKAQKPDKEVDNTLEEIWQIIESFKFDVKNLEVIEQEEDHISFLLYKKEECLEITVFIDSDGVIRVSPKMFIREAS